ncbi:MAG: T9SS type B sorting domain-containing protein [Cecembia sp.]
MVNQYLRVFILYIFIFLVSGNGLYSFEIDRTNFSVFSKEAGLSDLQLNEGRLEPRFNPNITSYRVDLEFPTFYIVMTPIASDANSTILVNGKNVRSGAGTGKIFLNPGENAFTIEVKNENSTPIIYQLIITRKRPLTENVRSTNWDIPECDESNPLFDEDACEAAFRDDDGDGVPNYLDFCPNTPPGTVVDEFGCPIDFENEEDEDNGGGDEEDGEDNGDGDDGDDGNGDDEDGDNGGEDGDTGGEDDGDNGSGEDDDNDSGDEGDNDDGNGGDDGNDDEGNGEDNGSGDQDDNDSGEEGENDEGENEDGNDEGEDNDNDNGDEGENDTGEEGENDEGEDNDNDNGDEGENEEENNEPLDSDGDGVPDDQDLCPDTPEGEEVDEFGCSINEVEKTIVIDYVGFDMIEVIWGTVFNEIGLPTEIIVTIESGETFILPITWAEGDYDPFQSGPYILNGTIKLPNSWELNVTTLPTITVLVLPKDPPLDLLLSNDFFNQNAGTTPILIGDFTVIDPLDDIHILSLPAGIQDNDLFVIIDNQLYWRNEEIAPGRNEFTIFVEVLDRAGNVFTKEFLISRRLTELLMEMEIPNTFTPDGDGINDDWGVPMLNIFDSVRLHIYERGGLRVFFTTDPNGRWDGTFEGKALPIDSYYYVIEVVDNKESRKGILNLLRNK